MKVFKDLYTEILAEYINQPIDLINIGDGKGEINYLNNMGPTYIRTIHDIENIYSNAEKSSVKILEIGAYLGFVSIGLAKLEYSVTAADLPVFMKNSNLQKLYSKYNIETESIDLQKLLPFEDNCFDFIILCETLEHLNFNPVPVISELKRILKKSGYLYISVPNLTKLENRLRMLKGISCYNSIDDFFSQLDPGKNFSVGLHWREYTMREISELLEKSGFSIKRKYYFNLLDMFNLSAKFYIRALYNYKNFRYIFLNIFQPLKENITLISQK